MRRRHIVINLSGQGIILLTGLLTGVLLARFLGPSDRGAYVLAVALSSLVMIATDRGRSVAIMAVAGENPGRYGSLLLAFGRSLRGRVVEAAAAGVLIGWVVFPSFADKPRSAAIVAATMLICAAGISLRFSVAFLMGLRRFGMANLFRAGVLVAHLTALLALYASDRLALAPALTSLAAANLLTAGASHVAVRRLTPGGGHHIEDVRPMMARTRKLEQSNRLSSMQLLETFQLDVLLLGVLSTTRQVGLYSVAQSVVSSIRPVGQTVGQPLHVHLLGGGRIAWRGRRVFVVVAAMIGGTAFAMGVVYQLVPLLYGEAYESSRVIAVVGVLGGILAAGRLFTYELLRGYGRAAKASHAELVAFAVYVPSMLALVTLAGALGSIVGVALANAVALLVALRGRGVPNPH